jgi:hypothetical protein
MDLRGLFTPGRWRGAGRLDDPTLGTLERRWGRWHGEIALGMTDGGASSGASHIVPLVVAGGRSGPDPACLRAARELGARYADLAPAIERALFEHYQPYGEAIAAGEEPPHPGVPLLTRAAEVRPHATPVRALIERRRGVPAIEIAYRVAWDEEHTLGAVLQEWALVELNGSVLV